MANPVNSSNRSRGMRLASVLMLALLHPLGLKALLAQAQRIVVGNLPGDKHDLFARALRSIASR